MFMKRNSSKFFILVVVLGFLIQSCSSGSNLTVQDSLANFVANDKDVVFFGKADIKTILEKAEYKRVPKVGLLLEDQLKTIEKVLDIKSAVHFAIKLDQTKQLNHLQVVGFVPVKNADSTVAEIKKIGEDVIQADDLSYFQHGDVTVGITDHLAMILVSNSIQDPKVTLRLNFEKVEEGEPSPKVIQLLNKKADILIAVSLENAFHLQQSELKDLPKEKQKEFTELMKDSYSETTIQFTNGKIIIENQGIYSKAFKNKLFLKNDPSGTILSKLGNGSPRIGLSINLDMKKLQAFMQEFSPQVMKKLTENMGGAAQMAFMMGGENGLSSMLNGQFGFLVFGDAKQGQGMVPDFNAYVGFGPKGDAIGELAKAFLSHGTMKVDVSKSGLQCASNVQYMTNGKLNLPKGCESFGKKGITAFLNFEGLDLSTFELKGEAKLLELVKLVYVEGDATSGRIIIQAKNGQENVLKQAVQHLLTIFQNQIGNMTI